MVGVEVVLQFWHKRENIPHIGLGIDKTQAYNAPCCKSLAGKENPIQDKATMPSNENFFLNLVKIWKHDTILWLKPVNKKSNYDYLPG